VRHDIPRTVEAVFDGEVLRPKEPVHLEPNTPVRITIEPLTQLIPKQQSFLQTAQSLQLEGPPDWSERIDDYLYESDKERAERLVKAALSDLKQDCCYTQRVADRPECWRGIQIVLRCREGRAEHQLRAFNLELRDVSDEEQKREIARLIDSAEPHREARFPE
jgi:predicted DNA-binding antitoxin AbrB/MazE fold protein